MSKKKIKASTKRLPTKAKKGTHSHMVDYSKETERQLVQDTMAEEAQGHTPLDNPALANEIADRDIKDPAFADRWNDELTDAEVAARKPVL